MEGLCSFKATPNLNIIYRGLNYATTLLLYLSCCPLATSKTLYFIFIFERKAYKVIVYAFCPYREPKIASEETLFWLNKTVLICLAKRQKY